MALTKSLLYFFPNQQTAIFDKAAACDRATK